MHPVHRCAQKVLSLMVEYLYLRGRFKTKGKLSSLNNDRPIVVVANHTHRMDPLVIMTCLPDKALAKTLPVKFMTANSHYFSWGRPLLALLGCFPSHQNKQGLRYGIEGSAHYLRNRYSFFIFPEGKRTDTPIPAKRGVYEIIKLVPGSQLVLAHISRSEKPLDYKITFDVRNSEDFGSAQSILDAIYKLRLPN